MVVPVVPVTTAANALLATMSKVTELGNNFYHASEAWEKFQFHAESFVQTYNVWKGRIDDFGIEIDPKSPIRKLLKDTEKKLEKQESRLKTPKWFIKMKWTAFPATIGDNLQQLAKEFDNELTYSFQLSAKAQRVLRETLSETRGTDFGEDERYVRLRETEKKVFENLRKAARVMVLLYGGIGTGKSAFARQLMLHISNNLSNSPFSAGAVSSFKSNTAGTSIPRGENQPLIRSGSGPSSSSCTPVSGVSENTTEGNEIEMIHDVLHYEWGPDSYEGDPNSHILRQIREHLGGADENDEGLQGPRVTLEQLRKRDKQILQGLLKKRKVLIIIDNLSDSSLVTELVKLSGDNVKILLTSRSSSLCDGLHVEQKFQFERIRIETMEKQVAVKLLQSHIDVGGTEWKKYDLPDIQEIGGLIDSIDVNPLAMACVADSICKDVCSDFQEWKKAVTGSKLSQLLGSKNEQRARIHGKMHPQSFWEAMEQAFNFLQYGKDLLILMSTFQKSSTSFHKELIKFLGTAVLKPEEFLNGLDSGLKELESQQFIDQRQVPGIYYIYLLVRLFMDEKRADKKDEIFKTCRDDPQARAINELQSGIVSRNADNQRFHIREEGANFLAHLAQGDDGAKRTIIDCAGEALILALDNLNESFNDVRENAALALANLASGNANNKSRIIRNPACRRSIARLLTKAMHSNGDDRSELQWHAARALANLVDGNDDDAIRNKREVLGTPRDSSEKLTVLVKAIARVPITEGVDQVATGHGLRMESARALANLAEGVDQVASEMEDLPVEVQQGTRELAINHLAQVLAGSDRYDLSTRLQVARIISSLVSAGDRWPQKILECTDVLKGLVALTLLKRSIFQDGVQKMHQQARIQGAKALCHLAGRDIKRGILEYLCQLEGREILSEFFRILSSPCEMPDSELRKYVSWTLRHLSSANDDDMRGRLLRTHEAIDNLLTAIVDREYPEIQLEAASILRDLLSMGSVRLHGEFGFHDDYCEKVAWDLATASPESDSTDSTLRLKDVCKKALNSLIAERWHHDLRGKFALQTVRKILELLPDLA